MAPSALPPPCLSIRVPGASNHSLNHSAPAFGLISTYSHRIGPHARPRRPSETSETSSCTPIVAARPAHISESPMEETLATGGLDTATSDWQGGFNSAASSDSELSHAHIALARLSAAPAPMPHRKTSSISLGVEPPTPDPTPAPASTKGARRTASIYSISHAFERPPSPTSPTGTYVSVANAHRGLRHAASRSLAPSRTEGSLGDGSSTLSRSTSILGMTGHGNEEKKGKRGALPVYQRHASDAVISVKTALGEGPGEREEGEGDRLKRLYLCPWDSLSPKTFRSRFGTSTTASDLEKQPPAHTSHLTSPSSRAHTARLRLLTLLASLLLLTLLLVDLLLLNIRAFRPSSHPPTSTESQSATCTSLFALTAPSKPLAYPCGTCFPLLTSLSPPSKRTLEQTQVVQFCALREVFSAAKASNTNSTLSGEGWMTSTDVCSYVGIGCDGQGRVTELALEDPNVPASMPTSLRELKGTLQVVSLNGVDYVDEFVG